MGPCPTIPILPRFQQQLTDGLALLLQAFLCACDVHGDLWDFGVEIASIRELGVSDTMLRWLSRKGAIQHRVERSPPEAGERFFIAASPVRFTANSVLVLTDVGYSLADQLGLFDSSDVSPRPRDPRNAQGRSAPATEPSVVRCAECAASAEQHEGNGKPYWDAMRRELWFQGQLAKRFRLPAPNQESILMAFQERHWPTRIDDPLPRQPSQLAQGRLRNTICALNRNQISERIRFHGDGTGEGVLWEAITGPLAEWSEP
jgi:hypothetical protein